MTVAQVQALERPSDPLDELAYMLGANRANSRFWEGTLIALATHLGTSGPAIETTVVCVDRQRQWRYVRNLRRERHDPLDGCGPPPGRVAGWLASSAAGAPPADRGAAMSGGPRGRRRRGRAERARRRHRPRPGRPLGPRLRGRGDDRRRNADRGADAARLPPRRLLDDRAADPRLAVLPLDRPGRPRDRDRPARRAGRRTPSTAGGRRSSSGPSTRRRPGSGGRRAGLAAAVRAAGRATPTSSRAELLRPVPHVPRPPARAGPVRASASGWARDMRHRPEQLGSASLSASAASGPNSRRQAGPSRPSPCRLGVHGPLDDRRRGPVEGVADRRVGLDDLDAAGGQVDRAEDGEARVSGTIVEQMSWRKPGSVSSSVRVPPPIVAAAWWSVDRVAGPRETVIAAGRGFGRIRRRELMHPSPGPRPPGLAPTAKTRPATQRPSPVAGSGRLVDRGAPAEVAGSVAARFTLRSSADDGCLDRWAPLVPRWVASAICVPSQNPAVRAELHRACRRARRAVRMAAPGRRRSTPSSSKAENVIHAEDGVYGPRAS